MATEPLARHEGRPEPCLPNRHRHRSTPFPPLYTGRLRLVQVSADDLGFFRRFLSSTELTRYLPLGRPYSEQEIEDFMRRRVEHWRLGFGYCLFAERDRHPAIGYVGIEYTGATDHMDIRYGVLSEYSGKGYVSEASRGYLAWFFSCRPDAVVHGVCEPGNLASKAILAKLNMTEDSEIFPYGGRDLVNMRLTLERFRER